MRSVLILLIVLIARTAAAQTAPAPDIMALVRGDRWAEAQAAANTYLDPVVPKLVTYFRLMAPGAASYDEIVAFQKYSPDWPLQGSLNRRREEALVGMLDDQAAAAACDGGAPALAAALLRCATAYSNLSRPIDAAAMANAAWVAGDGFIEQRMLPHWAPMLTRASQMRRFERLSFIDIASAAKQIAHLDTADKPVAETVLALRHDAPNAAALLAALSGEQRRAPVLVLEQLRWLRRANNDDAAVALWQSAGVEAERAISADHRAAFWDERNLMARRRLRQGDVAGAYALAAGHQQTGVEQIADAEFLAGFIALRRLNDPAIATLHFRKLAEISKAAITQGRAHYWLARAGGGAAEYQMAAAYPNTFYGQLAILALGQNLPAAIRAQHRPPPDAARALDFAGREVARAAAYLVGWGETRRAEAFMLRLDDITPDPVDRELIGRLALGFNEPQTAVALARRAGRDGVVELDTGWPAPVQIPADSGLDPSLGLGIIRQESSFDSTTTSPVGARGLMQLMPGTAATVAKQLHIAAPLGALTTDPELNLRLGSVYLSGLLDQFGGIIPYAVAGYNAGPGRVGQWVADNGDPTSGGAIDMIDWIELIPFGETRNYVQRVIENDVIYSAKANHNVPHPLAAYLGHSS